MNTMDVKKEKEYLKKKHGISTFQELREATKKLRLNIGVFVAPIPAVKPANSGTHG